MSQNYGLFDIIKDEITGNALQVNKQEYVNRIKICLECPNVIFFLPKVPSCKICGCFMKVKAKYSLSQCPDNPPRWLAVS